MENKMVRLENMVIEIQGDLLLQNKQIEELREEIRQLRVQLNQQKATVTPVVNKNTYRTVDIERVKQVMKEAQAKKNTK